MKQSHYMACQQFGLITTQDELEEMDAADDLLEVVEW